MSPENLLPKETRNILVRAKRVKRSLQSHLKELDLSMSRVSISTLPNDSKEFQRYCLRLADEVEQLEEAFLINSGAH